VLSSLEMLSNDTYSVFIDALNPGMTVQAFCGAEVRIHQTQLYEKSP
jgi:hypothetical protein